MVRSMTKAEVEAFMRDEMESSSRDYGYVCQCDWCGRRIYPGHDMLVSLSLDGKEVIRTCEYCARGSLGGPGIEEYLDVLGVWSWSGEAEDAERMATDRQWDLSRGKKPEGGL